MKIGLPSSWVQTTLGDIVQPTRPRHQPRDYPALPFIGMEHIQATTMRLLGTVPAGTMKSSAVHFMPNDVLYGRLRPYLNKVFRPDFEGLCSAEFIVFPYDPHIEPGYIQYLLNSAAFVSFASHLNTGDRPRVDFEQISSYSVPLPPRKEQSRIVAEIEKQFTRLDAAVEALKRVKANLKRYRASVLKAACEGRLVPTEAELARREGRSYEPASELLKRILAERRARWEADQLAKFRAAGKEPKDDKWKAKYKEPVAPDSTGVLSLPDGWKWCSLSMLTVQGPQNGLYLPQSSYGSGMPILRIDDFQDGWSRRSDDLRRVTASDSDSECYALMEGDLVINRVNSPSHLGKALLVSKNNLPALFESNMMRLHLSVELNSRFTVFYLQSLEGRMRLIKRAKWAVNQASINQTDVGVTLVPLPPNAEQSRIVAEVERRFSVIDELEMQVEANLKRADRLRQSILKHAFEGKLVPQDPDDEPASILLERIRTERELKNQTVSRRQKNNKPKVAV